MSSRDIRASQVSVWHTRSILKTDAKQGLPADAGVRDDVGDPEDSQDDLFGESRQTEAVQNHNKPARRLTASEVQSLFTTSSDDSSSSDETESELENNQSEPSESGDNVGMIYNMGKYLFHPNKSQMNPRKRGKQKAAEPPIDGGGEVVASIVSGSNTRVDLDRDASGELSLSLKMPEEIKAPSLTDSVLGKVDSSLIESLVNLIT